MLAIVLSCMAPQHAWADAPRDIQTSQRLWLDGLDTFGTDTGNGGGTRHSVGAAVSTWQDKSPNKLVANSWTPRKTLVFEVEI